jgi:hypothetical protein
VKEKNKVLKKKKKKKKKKKLSVSLCVFYCAASSWTITARPALYLFKFIVPSEADNVARVELAFDCMGAVIKRQNLKQGFH